MSKVLKYKGIVFDDYVIVSESDAWSQICSGCAKKLNIPPIMLDSHLGAEYICGVEGCENEADYYIDFSGRGYSEEAFPMNNLLDELQESIQSNSTKCATESKIDKAYAEGFNKGLEVALKLIDYVKNELGEDAQK